MTGVLGIGVLGCADIAQRRTLPAIRQEPRLRLAAVASRDHARAARCAERFGGVAVAGYAAALERDDVQAVYVPLPAELHFDWAREALLAGKHVLVEKPLTPHYPRAVELVALARSRGLVIMENFMFTFHSQHDAIRKLVADGAIGEVRAFASAFAFPPKPPGDIRYRPELGGGALLDAGGYPVRAAELYLGSGLRVVGATLQVDSFHHVDVCGAALLHTPAGVPVEVMFGMEHAYRSFIELWGGDGRLVLERAFTPPPDHAPVVRVFRQEGVEEIRLPADDQFARVVRAFADAALGDASTAEHEEAILRHAELMDQINRSATHILR